MDNFWWAGPIAIRNTPTVDGRGITRYATVRLKKGGAPLLTLATPQTSAEVVGEVGRIWNMDETAIWAQINVHGFVGEHSGRLYPEFDANPENFVIDDEPFPWFTSMEIIAITLGHRPCWRGIGPIVRPIS